MKEAKVSRKKLVKEAFKKFEIASNNVSKEKKSYSYGVSPFASELKSELHRNFTIELRVHEWDGYPIESFYKEKLEEKVTSLREAANVMEHLVQSLEKVPSSEHSDESYLRDIICSRTTNGTATDCSTFKSLLRYMYTTSSRTEKNTKLTSLMNGISQNYDHPNVEYSKALLKKLESHYPKDEVGLAYYNSSALDQLIDAYSLVRLMRKLSDPKSILAHMNDGSFKFSVTITLDVRNTHKKPDELLSLLLENNLKHMPVDPSDSSSEWYESANFVFSGKQITLTTPIVRVDAKKYIINMIRVLLSIVHEFESDASYVSRKILRNSAISNLTSRLKFNSQPRYLESKIASELIEMERIPL
jgi:hypothetical protein